MQTAYLLSGLVLSCTLASLAPAQAAYKDEVLADAPVGYWRLDEPTPPPIAPQTTAQNLGSLGVTADGTYAYGVQGQQPGALAGSTDTAARFDGTRFLQVPYSVEINPNPPFTVEGWFKPAVVLTGTTVTCPLASLRRVTPAAEGWIFYQTATGWNFRLGDSFNNYTADITGTTVIAADTWYHVAAVYDGTTVRLYVNGVEEATATTTDYWPNPEVALGIGARGDNTFHFNGIVDEVALYPTALSASTIAAHHANGIDPAPASPYNTLVLASQPLGYWRLNETVQALILPAAANLGSLGEAANGGYYPGITHGQPGALTGDANPAVGFDQNATPKQMVDVPYNAGLNPTSFTVECWARADSAGTGHRSPVTSRDDTPVGNATGYIFYADPGNVWQFWTGNGAGSPDGPWNSVGNVPVNLDTWDHLVGTYDGKVKNFYVNGVLVGSALPARYFTNPARVLRIGGGATEGAGNFFFHGDVDEVAVYDKALSGDRVLAHYKSGSGTDPLPAAPEIVAGPGPAEVFKGETLTLGVAATGSLPLTYEWRRDGTVLNGQTGPSIRLADAQPSDSGLYSVTVRNSLGEAVSQEAQVTVVDVSKPVITQQPRSRIVLAGASVTFTVAAVGSATFDYQWERDGTPIPGATGASLVIASVQASDLGSYRVLVSNAAGSTLSDAATLGFPSMPTGDYVSNVKADGPVAYWRLGETEAIEALDEIGNANPGYYSGGVTVGEPGAIHGDPNTAVRFNGVDGKIDVWWSEVLNPADLSDPPQMTAFTIECWAKVSGNVGNFRSPVTSRADAPQRGYIFYASDANTWQFWNGAAAGGWQVVAGPAVQLDTWVHLVGTYDGTVKRFYVNGTEVGSAATTVLANNEHFFRIGSGATEGNGNYWFNGVVDEVALYNKVLPEDRIWAHYLLAQPPTPTLAISRDQGNIVVTWTHGTLQAADAVTGATWQDVPNTTSPLTVTPTGEARFYRVRR